MLYILTALVVGLRLGMDYVELSDKKKERGEK